ncbi:MAG: S1 RNA-binding domain-containing protein, partial [Acidobacteriota bacterium]|nr:S1 RNA-binding domain-containing protein [Acidobacteriota bacterium]
IARSLDTPVGELIANPQLLTRVDARQIDAGAFTVKDILEELRRPGRDPREQFIAPSFNEKVREFADVQPEMILEGVVTNVTKFGAFVDIGVHQDGLVHISELSNRYIKDPSDAVKAGQIVKVKVLSADIKTKRIALSMKALVESVRTQPSNAVGGKPGVAKVGAGSAEKNLRPVPSKQGGAARSVPPPQASLSEKLALLSTKWKVS